MEVSGYIIKIKQKRGTYWTLERYGKVLSTSQMYCSRSNARRAAMNVAWDLDIDVVDETRAGK